jgi:hypothetical protein
MAGVSAEEILVNVVTCRKDIYRCSGFSHLIETREGRTRAFKVFQMTSVYR